MEPDHLIYIRTDGNSQIASGHLMRCLSIGNACKKLGFQVHFLVSDQESVSLLQRNIPFSFPVTCLKGAVYDHLEQELPELLPLLAGTGKQKITFLLDSYYVTKKYLISIKKFAKTVYIDDLMLFDYPVDLLVNYDVIPSQKMPSYQAAYQNAGKTLLGAAYAPLRDQFQNREMPVRSQVKNIFIATGGSDPFHFCLRFIDFLKETFSLQNGEHVLIPDGMPGGIVFHILVGSLNTDRDRLFSIAQTSPFIEVYENVTDMASLMESCDLAVSAAGTTLYELCALGIPAISYTMADNQLPSATAFAESEIIPYSGDIRGSMDRVLYNIMQFLLQMWQPAPSGSTSNITASYRKREIAHKTMRSFIDGEGSLKIARAIAELALFLI